MNDIAFVFTHAPHGSSSGREGLDLVLASANFVKKIALFFIGDGVLQLVCFQKPEKILARNYIVSFGILPLYDVKHYYACYESVKERGLQIHEPRILSVEIIPSKKIRLILHTFSTIITF
ncbi:sulfurtransferase complex subunit TusC [Candidatus Ishikawella capsulata]|uniref:Uncharacterized protein n=1 Tax=Candidatus Ishikawaella capsulata Mpkobe TaxID=476281 RepID=C5WCP8_9ENTR|nr:sulfurtransferase complex subunit TusC [Candidatus Ishikawaella capsulata]BAH83104.1 hypothetical protein tusC [Candidatus Ishikawaella capsulata Mpkobe]